jgi:hypothetical protein
MPTEHPKPGPAARKPRRPEVTSEDVERYGDEDQVRSAMEEGRLRDEQPPHHG